ncbi:hypothetical protein BC829DRAFT_384737 [Chytridium lagenaria]|nr:hypothetical protein BC829DRAFT_384737 [Chytridium lagenaria]
MTLRIRWAFAARILWTLLNPRLWLAIIILTQLRSLPFACKMIFFELRLEALLALARESELGEDEAPVKEIAVNRLLTSWIPSSLRVDNPIPAAKPVKGLEDLWVVRTLEYRVWFDDVDINMHMTGM